MGEHLEDYLRSFVKCSSDQERCTIYNNVLIISGYRLPFPGIPVKVPERKEILKRVRDDCKVSYELYKSYSKQMEESTRCRAIREMLGNYTYVDIENGAIVGAEEYEERFMEYAMTTKKSRKMSFDLAIAAISNPCHR